MINSRTKTWLTGCSIGCGAVILLGILASVGGSIFIMRPFKDAIATRETLEERHGEQADYTPLPDGAITADRLEAFLTVRSAIMELCDDFAESSRQFQRMEEMEDDTPKTEVFVDIMKLMKEIFGMVPRLGKFFEARNSTLFAVDMGLGEYTYIYVMVYRDRAVPGGVDKSPVFGDDAVNSRIHAALRQMLRNQLAGADEQNGTLTAEIARLEAEPERLPWQDGLPPALAASIAPFRERLDAAFCVETMGLELNKNQQRGLGIQGN